MKARSVFIKTFGCQMNVYDSFHMQSLLKEQGLTVASDLGQADIILINTCSIRDKSEHKVLSLLGQLKPLKEKQPDKVIGIAGCVGQRMGRTLLQRVPHLDLVFGPDGIGRVGELVREVIEEGKRIVDTKFDEEGRQYSQPALVGDAKVAEFLTIMKGCDHFCTYCIVPFVRGREKSRSVAEIVDDTKRLVAQGSKEVTFLGQNINTYGKGTGEKLSDLLAASSKVEGLLRIRYLTSHPRDMGQDLIDQFGALEKLVPALHLPFQAGSDAVLKRMSRLYTREEYLRKIELLRKACPEIALSTDVIVGFPGETEEDFHETLSVMSDVKFSSAFLFKYSPRPGTRAFAYEDEVPQEVKEERLRRVQDVAFGIIEKENRAMVGTSVECLIESKDKKGRYYSGRTPCNRICHVLNAGPACVGKILNVKISEGNVSNLKGHYVGAPRESGRVTHQISASL